MRKIFVLLILAMLAWKAYEKYGQNSSKVELSQTQDVGVEDSVEDVAYLERNRPEQRAFACDGRTSCVQMKSCDEAKYFLERCPNVTMDGNGDGVPCERQWCN